MWYNRLPGTRDGREKGSRLRCWQLDIRNPMLRVFIWLTTFWSCRTAWYPEEVRATMLVICPVQSSFDTFSVSWTLSRIVKVDLLFPPTPYISADAKDLICKVTSEIDYTLFLKELVILLKVMKCKVWILYAAASEGFEQEDFSWRYIEASMDYKECRAFREYKPLRKTLESRA